MTGELPRPAGRAMTDERKDAVLAMIGDAWKAQPEVRLGQLLVLWSGFTWGNGSPGSIASRGRILDGLFFIEDADLAHNLLRHASGRPQRG